MEERLWLRRITVADGLLLALILALPLMKPAVHGRMIVADLLFLLLAAAFAIEAAAGRRKALWLRGFGPLLIYVAALAPSLLATSDLAASLFKMATEFYLVGLAVLTALLVDNEAKLRRAVLAWLAATVILCLDGILGLASFATGRAPWLLDYSTFGYGSLPPGDYPRLALTFFNANMACNYLTVSLALLFLASARGCIGIVPFRLMLAGIVIAALSTVSPGLGGIALLAGWWLWMTHRTGSPWLGRLGLAAGLSIAVLFVLAQALTPVAHSTAPFQLQLPGEIAIYPAGRFLTWSAAWEQFVRHPLLGVGLGIDPVAVRFAAPAGEQLLTDAHNVFLSIAAQCGVVGLVGLAALIAYPAARTVSAQKIGRQAAPVLLLGAAFLDGFVYQGIGGSFEDTRHLWVLLGLLIAADRIGVSRADGNSRRPAAPSPG